MKKRTLRPPYSHHHIAQICTEPEGFRKTLFIALWNSFSTEARRNFLELTRLETKPISRTGANR